MARSHLLAVIGTFIGWMTTWSGLHAQVDWSVVNSGTTHTLWGVCQGGGQFVAVGEGGTILTSNDGTSWMAQHSGTDVWLTSVAYGLNHYVAVGEGGTVLASIDARTWENVSDQYGAAPRSRLNAVAFINGAFLIYGEQDAVERVSLPVALDWPGRRPGTGHAWRSIAFGERSVPDWR